MRRVSQSSNAATSTMYTHAIGCGLSAAQPAKTMIVTLARAPSAMTTSAMMSRPGFCAIAALLAVLSAPVAAQDLASRANAALRERGLGPDALRLVDNVLTHEFTIPPLTPPVVLEVLRNPLAGVDAATLFDRSIPADLRAFADLAPSGGAQPFEALLDA